MIQKSRKTYKVVSWNNGWHGLGPTARFWKGRGKWEMLGLKMGVRNNEVLPLEAVWMDLGSIMPGKVSQRNTNAR